MVFLVWLRNIVYCKCVGKHKLYDIVTQDLVTNSILSLHLGIWLWLMDRKMVYKFSQYEKLTPRSEIMLLCI